MGFMHHVKIRTKIVISYEYYCLMVIYSSQSIPYHLVLSLFIHSIDIYIS